MKKKIKSGHGVFYRRPFHVNSTRVKHLMMVTADADGPSASVVVQGAASTYLSFFFDS